MQFESDAIPIKSKFYIEIIDTRAIFLRINITFFFSQLNLKARTKTNVTVDSVDKQLMELRKEVYRTEKKCVAVKKTHQSIKSTKASSVSPAQAESAANLVKNMQL